MHGNFGIQKFPDRKFSVWEKNLNAGINGHVDVLQIRNGLVYILDFKPGAAREKVEKVASQLFFYASGLSFRTGITLDKFRCAWFDEKVYFEFEPSSAKVRFKQALNFERKSNGFHIQSK